MKDTCLRKFYTGSVGDIKNLEEHFAEMAERGWMIEKIDFLFHQYRAAEPCKKRFFVDILPQISAFDYPENDDAQDYRRICEESGWDFITANKQIHVFCADGDNPEPIPIHTDNSIQAKIYLRASRKYELPAVIFALIGLLINSPFRRGVELFLMNTTLYMAIGYIFFVPGLIWVFGFILSWNIKTKKSAKYGLPLPLVNPNLAKLRSKVLIIGSSIYIPAIFAGITLEIIKGFPIHIIFIFYCHTPHVINHRRFSYKTAN